MILCYVLWFSMVSCGGIGTKKNNWSPVTPLTPKEEAAIEARQGRYDQSIQILDKYIRENPQDTEAKNMLVSVRMRKAGLSDFQILQKLLAGGSATGLQTILGGIPNPTPENEQNLRDAIAVFQAMGNLTPEQQYQYALLQVSLAGIILKKHGGSEDHLDSAVINNLSEQEAGEVISALQAANSSLASSVGQNNTGSLNNWVGTLNSTSGSNKEKLQSLV